MSSNRIIANCQQNAPVKEFLKSVNIWRTYGQKLGGTFLWPTVYISSYRTHSYAFLIFAVLYERSRIDVKFFPCRETRVTIKNYEKLNLTHKKST